MLPMRLLVPLFLAAPAFALEPAEVVVVTNKNVPDSRAVAEHFLKARGVPAENVVALDLPKDEDISRKDYDEKLAAPLRSVLGDRKDRIKCLVCVYGVPLRVGGDGPTDEERAQLKELDPKLKEAEAAVKSAHEELKALEARKDDVLGSVSVLKKRRQAEMDDLRRRQEGQARRQRYLSHAESHAAVDSELMLLWWDRYELRR